MTNPSQPSDNLILRWNALLDGELPPEEAQALRVEIESNPEARRFIEAQERFNLALSGALKRESPSVMPGETLLAIRTRIGDSSKPASLSLLHGGQAPAAPTSRWVGWNYAGMAAMLFLGLVIGAVVFGEGSQAGDGKQWPVAGQPNDRPVGAGSVALSTDDAAELAHRRLDLFSGKATELMLDLGPGREKLREYAQAISFKHAIPDYPKHGTCDAMSPVSIDRGQIEGLPYESVSFCTGPRVADGLDVDGVAERRKLFRIVMFIVEGDLRPGCSKLDNEGMWVSCGPSRSFAARWDAERKQTYLVFVPGNCDEQRARELASPLLVSVGR